MHSNTQKEHFNKSLPVESGSAKSMPLPDPGTCHSDAGGASYMTYAEQLKSPKWQKKRLNIMERDQFRCQDCGSIDDQLHVHHLFYLQGKKAWDYPDEFYITLCDKCHIGVHTQTELLYKEIAKYVKQTKYIGNLQDYLIALRVAIHISPEHASAYRSQVFFTESEGIEL
ncbi:MAG TPA: HNH endonuclease [Bacteroidales bacterium]|nr:HNH endonuclease [Bacteroidales bacterium]